MNIVAFMPHHILGMDVQPAQLSEFEYWASIDPTLNCIKNAGTAITGLIDDKPVFCIGRVWQRDEGYTIWAILSESANKYLLQISRMLNNMLQLYEGDGVHQLIIDAEFENGRRWVEDIFKFKYHERRNGYMPNGHDALIYMRYL